MNKISPRKRELLNSMAYEFSSKEIANKLFVNYATIISHGKDIMRKLEVKNVAGMVRVAFQCGLLTFGLLFLAQTSHAQQRVEIDPLLYNYRLQTKEVSYDSPCIFGLISDFNTCIAGFARDIDQQSTLVTDLDDLCVSWDTPEGGGRNNLIVNDVITELSSAFVFPQDFTAQFYNNSPISPRCSVEFALGDCGLEEGSILLDLPANTPGIVSNFTLTTSSSNEIKLEFFRRPTFGTVAVPIPVGVLGSQAKYHVNTTAVSPISSATVDLDYNNDYTFISNSPDVSYSFTVENTEVVTITTDFPTTNFSMQMTLFEFVDGFQFANPLVSQTSSASSLGTTITAILEPGDYVVVLEGSTVNQEGRFEVEFASSSIQPRLQAGSISGPSSLFEFEEIPEITSLSDAGINTTGLNYNALSQTPVTYRWEARGNSSNNVDVFSGESLNRLPQNVSRKFPNETYIIDRIATIGDFDNLRAGVFITLNTARPDNDDYIDATDLFVNPVGSENVVGFVDNRGSQPSTTEQFSCLSSNQMGSGRDVWFKMIIPTSRRVEIEITNNSPCEIVQDWVMAVYRGSCSSTLEEIDCNDDQPGSIRQPRIVLSSDTHMLTAGETVFIRIIDFASNDAGCAFITANNLGCISTPTVESTGFGTSWFSSFSWFTDRVPDGCDDVVINSQGDILIQSANQNEAICRTLEVNGGELEVRQGTMLNVSGQ